MESYWSLNQKNRPTIQDLSFLLLRLHPKRYSYTSSVMNVVIRLEARKRTALALSYLILRNDNTFGMLRHSPLPFSSPSGIVRAREKNLWEEGGLLNEDVV